MEKARTLTSATELKAYLHRTRMTILSHLKGTALTVSQLGERMNVHPANLSRHLRVLETAGLIERVAARSALEKPYRAVALRYEVAADKGARKAGPAIALDMVRSDLEAAAERAEASNERIVTALLERAPIDQKRAASLARELRALVERFGGFDDLGAGEPYHLSVCLYPGGEWEGPEGPIEIGR